MLLSYSELLVALSMSSKNVSRCDYIQTRKYQDLFTINSGELNVGRSKIDWYYFHVLRRGVCRRVRRRHSLRNGGRWMSLYTSTEKLLWLLHMCSCAGGLFTLLRVRETSIEDCASSSNGRDISS